MWLGPWSCPWRPLMVCMPRAPSERARLQTAGAALGIYKSVENVALALVHVIVRCSFLLVCPFPCLIAPPLHTAVLLCSRAFHESLACP